VVKESFAVDIDDIISYNINLLNYHDNNTSRCTIKISRADIYRGLDLIKLIGEASEKIDPPRIYFLCEAYSKTHLTRIVIDGHLAFFSSPKNNFEKVVVLRS